MIRRSIKKLIRWANNFNESYPVDTPMTMGSSGSTINSSGMNFTVFNASGGYIIEYRKYDTKLDRNTNNLHIINTDEDLGERIGQIITLEILRN